MCRFLLGSLRSLAVCEPMPKYTTFEHVSPRPPHGLSSFNDVCAESDVTSSATDSDDEHTLTAFGDVSLTEEYTISSATNGSRRNHLCLKLKRPSFPKKRKTNPAGKFPDLSGSPPPPSPLSPFDFFESFRRHPHRSDKRRTAQLSQSDSTVEAETQPRAADSQESTSSSSNDSDYEPGQSMVAKDVPLVAEVPEPATNAEVGCQ